MRARFKKRICLFIVLLPFFWGCRDFLAGLHHHGEQTGNGVPVRIVLGDEGISRTIAPDHVPQADLGDTSKYTLRLDGTSDRGGTASVPNFTLAGGAGTLLLDPGNWTLTLTATAAGSGTVLAGRTIVSAEAGTMATARITLTPQAAADGTVEVTFSLPHSVVKRLDPQGNADKKVTAALHDTAGLEVAGTRQEFTVAVPGGTNPATITYTASGTPVPPGRYRLELGLATTAMNSSTHDLPVTYDMGWSDTLYVEAGRKTTATVTLTDTDNLLGIPGRPYKWDKASRTGFSVASTRGNTTAYSAANITGSQTFSPYGEGLWVYAANWDGGDTRTNAGTGGNSGGTQGNEVLLVTWDPVYDADYYELEMLLHPDHGLYNTSELVANSTKYDRLPVSDADWEGFRAKSPPPLEMRWSGGEDSSEHYKNRIYIHSILTSSATTRTPFIFLAWRDIANDLGGGTYRVATAGAGPFIGAPDPATGLSTRNGVGYRIGLEGNCNALAVMVNSFSPQHWYGIRVRAVNRFGHSDWVYWKGGKN